jgi:creatinine amidohydrolase
MSEFILITAHRHEPHLDALATLVTQTARVRVVSAWDVDIADLLDFQPGPLHGCEAETSVMLYLYPELVRMDRARDFALTPEEFERYIQDRLPSPPVGGAGVIGYPTAATAAKGEAIYIRMREAIRTAIFAARGDAESDTV